LYLINQVWLTEATVEKIHFMEGGVSGGGDENIKSIQIGDGPCLSLHQMLNFMSFSRSWIVPGALSSVGQILFVLQGQCLDF
jgi:hypothetical protein